MGYGPLSSYAVIDGSGKMHNVHVTAKGLVLDNPKVAATPAATLPSSIKKALPPEVKKGR